MAVFNDYGFDLLDRRHDKFVLWIPGTNSATRTPRLVLGTYSDTSASKFRELLRQELIQSTDQPAIWELAPSELQAPLGNDTVYHYWFEVADTSPEARNNALLQATDPLAFTVDYRVQWRDGPQAPQPAAVIKYRAGKLWPCDLNGQEPPRVASPAADSGPLLANNHLVIYELPTSWVKSRTKNGVEVDAGTFADVQALFEDDSPGQHFAHLEAVGAGHSLLCDLGINAVELLPAADAKPTGEWGYATAHYFAPDADLGPASDLASLAGTLQNHNVRLFTDVVMAFGHDPYRYIDFPTFHIRPRDEPDNPDSRQSGNNGGQFRDGWGGESWRYATFLNTYDPATGRTARLSPARKFHIAHLTRWMKDFGVSGLRLDSVNNTGSWDFIREYRAAAWRLWAAGRGQSEADVTKFSVIGEELSMPSGMLHDFGSGPCLDALWNEPWQARVRAVILGQTTDNDSFEWTVRKMIDPRLDSHVSFADGSQAINYITSHDVEGPRKERLCNYLWYNHVNDAERRAKLAHVCLLTAVGIPMILAGEEFCDEHDLPIASAKQVDPVNYARLAEDWRKRVFDYVATLVKFRAACPALGTNDTEFIHVDGARGGRIMAWKRGGKGGVPPVVVVANFSDEDTPGEEYYVPSWPERERADWREVTQRRAVPREWVGREPLKHWEAKVYTYWRE